MKMKNRILSICFVALTAVSLSSCNKFLDKDPLGQIAEDEFFNSETNANAAVIGAYRTMTIIQVTHSEKNAEYGKSIINMLDGQLK